MYSSEVIKRTCGESALRYARRKATGGASGQKGTRYEDSFAIFKIAESAVEAFKAGAGSFDLKWDVTVYSQILCFIDDLVLRRGQKRYVIHFQAKNRQTTSWGNGSRSLKSDFARQLKLCTSLKLKCSLNLVVSDEANSKTLSASIAPKLKRATSVIHFPYEKLTGLLQRSPAFSTAFAVLSPRPSPTDSDLLSTATLLMGVWVDTGNRARVSELLAEMETRSVEGGAPTIRPLHPKTKISAKLKAVLDGIPGFHYYLEKGFMHWQFGSTDSGSYRYACSSKEFAAFAKRQVKRQPKTYEDIEGELA